ncbi:hypothetical protein MKZ38_000248 [Zalerion maritima]|uniref:Uncharacterized protein n=1 Tax=Zalerion maritima TaxID=339359 RepID=A0AAD5WU54_9PEZI|nr:hypothetical protein MKZ38_000248 [Zalerion maritima]
MMMSGEHAASTSTPAIQGATVTDGPFTEVQDLFNEIYDPANWVDASAPGKRLEQRIRETPIDDIIEAALLVQEKFCAVAGVWPRTLSSYMDEIAFPFLPTINLPLRGWDSTVRYSAPSPAVSAARGEEGRGGTTGPMVVDDPDTRPRRLDLRDVEKPQLEPCCYRIEIPSSPVATTACSSSSVSSHGAQLATAPSSLPSSSSLSDTNAKDANSLTPFQRAARAKSLHINRFFLPYILNNPEAHGVFATIPSWVALRSAPECERKIRISNMLRTLGSPFLGGGETGKEDVMRNIDENMVDWVNDEIIAPAFHAAMVGVQERMREWMHGGRMVEMVGAGDCGK